MMIPIALHVEPNQRAKIRRALKKRKGCRIKVKKENGGTNNLLLGPRHLRRYGKAQHGSVVDLPFKHEELMENMRHKGGFLPLIAAALAPVIGGIAGGLIEKEISGSGLPKLYTVKKCGSGLKLNPWVGQM